MKMDAIHIKNAILAALSVVGSAITNTLGGWDVALKVLVCLMAADYITGLLVAAIWHRSRKSESGALESAACFKGLVRKCMVLVLVWMAAMLDRVMNTDFTRTAVCLFFIANEGLSILENTAVMGVPYPSFIRNMLEALRDKSDKGGEEKTAEV